jgi:hypothetical protein
VRGNITAALAPLREGVTSVGIAGMTVNELRKYSRRSHGYAPCGDRLKHRLMQCQPGPPAQVRKRHRQQGLGARRLAVSVRPTIRPDNSLRRNDFAKDSCLPMIPTVWSTLVNAIGSALTQLPSENGCC